MIGTYEDAAAALGYFKDRNKSYYLGEGSSRVCFLINGVVYKVNRNRYNDNLDEWNNFNRLSTIPMPQGVFIPEMHYFGALEVIACDFIDGIPMGDCLDSYVSNRCSCDSPCISADIANYIVNRCDITDLAYGNAMYCDGVIYLVDIAC